MPSRFKRVATRNSQPRRDGSQPQPRRSRALIIGIQYAGSIEGAPKLKSCHEDARDFHVHLIKRWGYLEEDITVMLDTEDHLDSELYPSRANILMQIDKLVHGAQPGDQILFYFAGHGYQLVSHNPKNEPDGYDEAILTADNNGQPYDQHGKPLDPSNISDVDRPKLEGLIIDNVLHEHLVDNLHLGAYLVSIFDCCHSGTMLDLSYHWINKVKRRLSLPLPCKTTSRQGYPQSLNKRATIRSSGGLSMLNRYPPSRKSTRTTQASTKLEGAWLSDTLCMSPTQEDGDDDYFRIKDETNIRKWSLRRQQRKNERSFWPASLVMVSSSPLDCPSDEGSDHRSHANVICIAPTEDHGVTPENPDADNRSFTASLITVIENSPRGLTLKEFMERLRFFMFLGVTKWVVDTYKKKGRQLDESFRSLRRFAVKEYITSPQLGSTQPLDLNAPFELSRTRTSSNGPKSRKTRSFSLPTKNKL